MKKRKIILVYGKTGGGKTTLAKKFFNDSKRAIVIDSLFEYESDLIFYDLDSLINYFNTNKPLTFKIVCRFSNDFDIEGLFVIVKQITNVVLILEEAEIYISPYTRFSNFLYLVRYGRHFNINIIGIARRSSELSLDFRSQVNAIYICSAITEPLDLKNFSLLGLDVEKIKNLKQYEIYKKTF
jgi:GTPase SAR1 family protein